MENNVPTFILSVKQKNAGINRINLRIYEI